MRCEPGTGPGRASLDLSNRYGTARGRITMVVPRGAVEMSSATLALQPLVYSLFENVQRQRAGQQQHVVEFAHVEPFAQFALGAGAEFLDLQFADFVGQGL